MLGTTFPTTVHEPPLTGHPLPTDPELPGGLGGLGGSSGIPENENIFSNDILWGI